jgi:predicted HicB family RNase H-like nuclease
MALKKPTLNTEAALNFAERKSSENKVPIGDVRMTANVSKGHHRKIKMAAAREGTTIGELLEQLINKYI